MIEQHEKLLAAIADAEKAAAALAKTGAKISAVQTRLKQARFEIESRIQFYQREAKEKTASKKAEAKVEKLKANQSAGRKDELHESLNESPKSAAK